MTRLPYPDPPLMDGELSLRPWRVDDLADVVAAVQDPEIPRWTDIPSPYGEREGRAFLGGIEAERAAGRALGLAAVSEGRLVGACGLTRFDERNRKAEIGYWVAAGDRRRGFGARATSLVARWALESLGLERVELLANPANEPSQRLAERAGFTREGTLRRFRVRKGLPEDLVMFSMLRSEL